MIKRIVPLLVLLCASAVAAEPPIDRQALVARHNPVIRRVDCSAPLTVGNGGFAFTVDITGLQTFGEQYHRNGVPLETLARWCWVSDPNPKNYTLADASVDFKMPDGSKLAFPTRQSSPAGDWLRKNPRQQPLGQLSLEWDKPDGTPFVPEDVQEPEQTLDLWRGIITSKYKLGGVPVTVTTVCDPQSDTVAVRLESALVAAGKLHVRLAFPRGDDPAVKNTPALDWSQPESHTTKLIQSNRIEHDVINATYFATCDRDFSQTAPHAFRIAANEGKQSLEFALGFAQSQKPTPGPAPAVVLAASAAHWQNFWRTGAVVDFSDSTNPQAVKLEERIVLSQYLLAVQMAGDVPPQESGLTCNTWYGKHHTEMIWWHTAHFALWGQDALLARNLSWFQSQLPAARALAQSRGLPGARWAKMTGPEMRESPGGNPLILWNQPHPIYLCELLYRNAPTSETLAKYRELVLETADCMAALAHFDDKRGQYVLGPPLWIAQEIYDQATSQDPMFEIAYWRWALGVAQHWRERLGLPREKKWDDIVARLSPLPEKAGRYVALGSNPDTWENSDRRHDHPSMLMPLGFLPGEGVDRATMGRTFDAVLAQWDWAAKIWGWDYPMIAMTAARLGRPAEAVEILLREGPNNHYLPNGHCPQRSDELAARSGKPGARKYEIAVYLPANGAFLSAVALMVAGWDGCTEELPGFPKDGTWKIRAEGLHRLP